MIGKRRKISETEEELVIASELSNLPKVEKLSQHIAKRMEFSAEQSDNLAIALTELVINAITHGNQKNPEKRVHINVHYDEDYVTIIVTDEGKGFNLSQLKNPTDPQNLWRQNGRGIFLVRNLIDEVEFITTREGTKVIIKEYREAPQA